MHRRSYLSCVAGLLDNRIWGSTTDDSCVKDANVSLHGGGSSHFLLFSRSILELLRGEVLYSKRKIILG